MRSYLSLLLLYVFLSNGLLLVNCSTRFVIGVPAVWRNHDNESNNIKVSGTVERLLKKHDINSPQKMFVKCLERLFEANDLYYNNTGVRNQVILVLTDIQEDRQIKMLRLISDQMSLTLRQMSGELVVIYNFRPEFVWPQSVINESSTERCSLNTKVVWKSRVHHDSLKRTVWRSKIVYSSTLVMNASLAFLHSDQDIYLHFEDDTFLLDLEIFSNIQPYIHLLFPSSSSEQHNVTTISIRPEHKSIPEFSFLPESSHISWFSGFFFNPKMLKTLTQYLYSNYDTAPVDWLAGRLFQSLGKIFFLTRGIIIHLGSHASSKGSISTLRSCSKNQRIFDCEQKCQNL